MAIVVLGASAFVVCAFVCCARMRRAQRDALRFDGYSPLV
tara:strand:+ start:456 stop:575 length:120 start_codon:yes stop_codon:yes gene_type:complete